MASNGHPADLPKLDSLLTPQDHRMLQAAADAELQNWRASDVEREVDAMNGAAIRAMRARIASEQRRCEALAEVCRSAQRAIGTVLTKGIGS